MPSNSDLEHSLQERKFLHDLASTLSIAVLYAGLMQESQTLSHLKPLMQAHADILELIKSHRIAIEKNS